MLSNDLKSKIKWLWDRFWAGGLSNPITAIEQISYLLFMRRLEYVDQGRLIRQNLKVKWSFYTTEFQLKKDEIKRFEKNKDLLAQKINEKNNELLTHIKEVVFPFIQNLNDPHEPFTQSMENAVFLIDKPSLLREAVDTIDSIYVEIEKEQKKGQHFQDTQGDLYEFLLDATSQAGKNGQFRTPRHIIQMMCEIISPDVDDKICDLTSGTAGFLVGAYQHILTKYSKKKIKDENGLERNISGDELNTNQKIKLKEDTFFGFDIDQTMVRIGLMNLIMHGITEPHILHIDTLSSDYDKYELDNRKNITRTKSSSSIRKEQSPHEKYTVILANPPFTGRIDQSGLSNDLKRINSAQSELLFLDRIIHMLAIEGRAAVIIPEGVLFGSGKAQKKTREILLKDCCLDAIISLPSGVFQPYAGVKTSILIFTKKKLYSETFNTKNVWFYGMESDGYSLDTNRKKLRDNPLPLVINEWNKKEPSNNTDRKQNHFFVGIDEIIQNGLELSYNEYKEYVFEERNYEPPKELLARLIELEKEIFDDMNELNELI